MGSNGMTARLLALIALLLLSATVVAAINYTNTKADATVVLDTSTSASLTLECNHPAAGHGTSATDACHAIDAELHIDFGKGGTMVEGKIVPKRRQYTWDDLLLIRNDADEAVLVDIDVSGKWPSWAGIRATSPVDPKCAWFVQPDTGDTGCTVRLAPHSPMTVGFQLRVPQGISSSGFTFRQAPTIVIKASPVP
jgi:hypothetical protein